MVEVAQLVSTQEVGMHRTPEPELMTGEEQAEAYTGADLSELHQPMVECFRDKLGALRGGRLLDLGCGGADMTIRFAREFSEVEALAVDGSEAMLRCARRAVAGAGLADRIRLERRLLPDAALATRSFDAVIANSLLHHLADPASLWNTVREAARPAAAVMVMDLRRPADAPSAERLVARHADSAHPVLRKDFLNSLCAAYTVAEVRQQLAAAGLPWFQVEEIGELHVLAWGRTK